MNQPPPVIVAEDERWLWVVLLHAIVIILFFVFHFRMAFALGKRHGVIWAIVAFVIQPIMLYWSFFIYKDEEGKFDRAVYAILSILILLGRLERRGLINIPGL